MSFNKNFVVSFRNDSNNINTIMKSEYRKNIMDIMIAINSCDDFEEANRQKIPLIQDYIYKNMKHIDYLNYLYGYIAVIEEYIIRFGPIVYSPILDVDFATIIIDNIIIIHEAVQQSSIVKEEPVSDNEYLLSPTSSLNSHNSVKNEDNSFP